MAVTILSSINGVKKTDSSNGYSGKPITEILTNGFFTVDRRWTVKYWNRAAETLLGVKAKDIIGKNLWEEFAGAIPINFYEVYHKAFLQDIPVHFEEYWGEMGSWFDVITYHCDDTLSVSFKSSNQLVNPEYSTHPQHPVQQLKTLNELYKFVTEVTNDCLWEWDLKAGEIFWIDGGHKRVFGYQVENALIPQSFWESRLHPDDKARLLANLNKVIIEGPGTVWEDEYRFKKANGDYAFVHERGHIIYDEDNKATRMIGATLDITEKVTLENKLVKEREARLHQMTDAVLTAQEKERADIGKEMHDNLNQILAVAKLYIQMGRKNEKDREMYLEKSCGFIVNVIEEIRRISKNLLIPAAHIIGMVDNVKNLINDLAKTHPIKIDFYKNDLIEEALDEKLQRTIFRIVQEQLTNILKHSKASHATINLTMRENQITLLIADNGQGCDTSIQKNGVGILNIRSRAELYGGGVTIVSEPGEGYEMKVVLPFKSPDPDSFREHTPGSASVTKDLPEAMPED